MVMRKYVLDRPEIEIVKKEGRIDSSYVLDVSDDYFRTMGTEQSKKAMTAAEKIVKAAGVKTIRPVAYKNPESVQKPVVVAMGELDDVTRDMLTRVDVPRHQNTPKDAAYTPVSIEICPLTEEADF